MNSTTNTIATKIAVLKVARTILSSQVTKRKRTMSVPMTIASSI